MTPACMTPDELALWRRGGRGSVPCIDCPLGFAADMRDQGRCNGQPQQAFGRPRLYDSMTEKRRRQYRESARRRRARDRAA